MVKQKSRGIASLPKRFDEGDYIGVPGGTYQYTANDYTNTPTAYQHTSDIYANGSTTEGVDPYIVGAGKPGETITGGTTPTFDTSGGSNVTDANQTAAETARLTRLNEVKAADPDLWTQLTKLPGQMIDKYLGTHTKADGTLDLMGIGKDLLSLGAGVAAYNQAGQPTPKTGYQGKIKNYTALQGKANDPSAAFRTGQGGHQYFTGLTFADPNADQSGPLGLAALQAAKAQETADLNAANAAREASYTAAHPKYVDNDVSGDKFFGRTTATDLTNNPKVFTNATVPSGTGSDTLPGGTGVSTVVGGKGNDVITPVSTVVGGTGVDTIKGGGATDAITAMYRQYLGKDPDAEGLAYWKSQFGDTVDPNELNTFLGTATNLLKNNPNNTYGVAQDKINSLLGKKDVAEVGGKDSLPPSDDEPLDKYMPLAPKFNDEEEPLDKYMPYDRENTGFGEGQKTAGGLGIKNLDDMHKFNDEGMVAPSLNTKPGESAVGGGIAALAQNGIGEQPPSEPAPKFIGSNKFNRDFEDNAMYMAAGGSTSPRGTYLQGHTDGMADKIPGTIDGIQPARLAHGEFVVPADVVSHLGNGNSDAGAQQLYKMMDKVRMARTGTKEQGKRINPNKFMPGGLAGLHNYAKGGVIRFDTGATVPAGVIGQEQGLSDWAGDYTTDMMAKAQALVNAKLANPDVYTGELSAGDSALQQQAYANAAKLAVPTSIAQAANTAGTLADKMANLSYNPTTVQSAYTAPGNLGYTANQAAAQTGTAATLGNAPTATAQTGTAATLGAAPTMTAAQMEAANAGEAKLAQAQGYNAERAASASFAKPEDIAAQQVSSGPALTAFQMQAAQSGYAPSLTNYQAAAPAAVKTDKFIDPGTAQAYMSPYMQQVVENQQREAQRQADIASTSRHAGATQAGAFGGSRQAIMDAEAARNLATQKGDIQATGLQNAYTNAQQQFNAEQGYGLQGQIANQGAGVTVGGQNLSANLATQQLGAQTGLQVAMANLTNEQQAAVQNQASQLQAQGMTAQQALQAAMANQSAGLQASQANQGMAYNTAAQNAQLQQQTALANQAAGNQAGQFGASAQNNASLANSQAQNQMAQYNAGLSQQANTQNAQLAQQAAAANQALQGQYGITQGQMSQQMGLANLANQQQAELANQALSGQYGLTQGQLSQQMGLANLSNQQQTALANQNATNAASQFGAGQNLASAQTAAQYGQAANALNAQNAQFGAGYGLNALQGATSAAATQGQLGTAQNQAGLANLASQLQAGNQQQATVQAGDVAQKAAFDEQKMDPYNQLNFQNSLLANKPITSTSYNFQNNPLTAAAGAASATNTLLGGTNTTTGATAKP